MKHNFPLRHPLALTVSTALAMIAGSLQAEVALAGGDLFARAAVRTEYDSNIYANNLEKDDVLFRLTPGLLWVHDTGLIRAEMAGGVEFQQFCDHTEDNSSNPYGSLDLKWAREEGKSEGMLSAAHSRLSYANAFVNERTKMDDLSLRGSFGHFVTEKLGYRVKAVFTDQDYLTGGYSSVRKALGGVEGRYQYSPKLEAVLGYTYRDTTTRHRNGRASIASTDHRILAGFDGELLPKVTGRLAVGVVNRQFDTLGLEDETGLLVETALDWTPDEGTTVSLFAKRDFDTSPVDQTMRTFETGVDFARKVTEKLTVSAGLSYEHCVYVGGITARNDDVIVARARAAYAFTKLIEAAVDVSNRASDSTLAISDYNKLVFGATVVAKF